MLWQPIHMERPLPRLLSASGVRVSFFIFIFSLLFWSFSNLPCLSFHVGPLGGGELSHLPGQGEMELVFG